MNQGCANFDSMSGLATKPGIAYENKKQVAKYKFSKEKDCADKLMSTGAAVCYTYWPKKTGWDFNCFLQSTVDGAKTYDHETTCSGKKKHRLMHQHQMLDVDKKGVVYSR